MLSLDQQLSEANNRKNYIPSVEKNLYTEPNVFKYHYTKLHYTGRPSLLGRIYQLIKDIIL